MSFIDRLSERELQSLSGYKALPFVVMSGGVVPTGPARPFETLESVGGKRSYWKRFKHEMLVFICLDVKKYADIKKRLKAAERQSATAVVAVIAAAVGAKLGVAAGALVPICALFLQSLLRVGTDAYCMGQWPVQKVPVEKVSPPKSQPKRKKKAAGRKTKKSGDAKQRRKRRVRPRVE